LLFLLVSEPLSGANKIPNKAPAAKPAATAASILLLVFINFNLVFKTVKSNQFSGEQE
jgi:hypothetical protein